MPWQALEKAKSTISYDTQLNFFFIYMPSQALENIRSYVKILNKLKVSCLNKFCKKVKVVPCAKQLKTKTRRLSYGKTLGKVT